MVRLKVDLPQLAGAQYVRLLRDRPMHMVCEIRLHGKPAYLKLFRNGDPADTVRRTEARLHEAAQALGQGQDAVVLPLHSVPDQGVLVLEAAPGAPSATVLASARATRRAWLLGRIGSWLLRLTAPSRERGTFGPRFWLTMAEERLLTAEGDWIDRELVAGHMAQLRAEAFQLRGASVERAASHGDLTPDNIFWDETTGRMTGIDMQGGAMIPVALDIARLLAWLEGRRPSPAAETIDGIAAADFDALVSVPGLLAEDQRPILRFLIGVMMLGYYLYCPRQPRRRGLLAEAMRNWIR
ncbi:Phosphotransferase enzyme family protein [Paracoccus halophilus]|uniref:Phosphotransferase enzyme family protein n=1 Tax=Paracoccus halophilus TaxID=376733 RepID=A0A1I0TV60_9RHOB|nr:phosphotransferase [Paracoccus halophilus]SFA55582.1 Phosphotransferase enzyme family protein [Paracoccus halophilus]